MKVPNLVVALALSSVFALFVNETFAADLPIREVILYKHGVGFFARTGRLNPGETARLEFKAEDMNDVLKSLTLADRLGGKIGGVRYDASEPLDERLKDFPFAVGANLPLTAFLDQMKGAQIEMKGGAEPAVGVIVGARVVKGDKDHADRETVTLLSDSGELRTFDLAASGTVKFADPKQQTLLKEYLSVLSQARSKDRRSVYIDSGAGSRELVASYLTPAPVWKSSYRLLFAPQGEPTLEGWAIVDNTSGEDWTGVRLAVVSGRPISFVTSLYEPRYVERPTVELAENRAVAPQVFAGALEPAKSAPAPMAMAGMGSRSAKRAVGHNQPDVDEEDVASADKMREMSPMQVTSSTLAGTAQGREAGELFEYGFPGPVTVKKGESAMLPFLQQHLGGRKLLIYSENFGLNPMNAAEITNSTGKTLDGGPITVYDGGSYAGEALVETVKAGDKRLISYGIDLGTRITTGRESSKTTVREIHLRLGTLTTRVAAEEVKAYTIKNVDPKAKTLVIEHGQRPGYKLLEPAKPTESTAAAYRFEIKLGPSAAETFTVREERVYDQSVLLTNLTPNLLATWVQNKALSQTAQQQLEGIARKKREIVTADEALRQTDANLTSFGQYQDRLRRNMDSLRNITGQQEQVQTYARQLAANEVKIANLRDSQSDLRKKKGALDVELATLIEKAEF